MVLILFYFFKLTIKVSFLTFKCQILFCNQFIVNIVILYRCINELLPTQGDLAQVEQFNKEQPLITSLVMKLYLGNCYKTLFTQSPHTNFVVLIDSTFHLKSKDVLSDICARLWLYLACRYESSDFSFFHGYI